jgi:hypothetical protein
MQVAESRNLCEKQNMRGFIGKATAIYFPEVIAPVLL